MAGKNPFGLLTYQSRERRVFLTRTLLEADIKTQRWEKDPAADAEWAGVWRSAWEQSHWSAVKASLNKLEYLDFRPRSKYFMECAFVVIEQHFLKRHRSQLELWPERSLEKERILENYEEYCAILRDCRIRKAGIDASFYTFLLDIMDF